jgi:hypothetical protein
MKKLLFLLITSSVFLTSCSDSSTSNNCGDSVVDIGEECDGENFSGSDCKTIGYHDGNLACGDDCKLILDDCELVGQCGDEKMQVDYEECDGINLNSKTCATLLLGGGTLKCSTECMFDTSQCENDGICGNGILEGSESCDSTNLNNQNCITRDYYSGNLTCNNCEFDETDCILSGMCGDGLIQDNHNEECDGENFGDNYCGSLGFYGGDLICDNCVIDTTDCISEVSGECSDPLPIFSLPFIHSHSTFQLPSSTDNPCTVFTGTGNQMVYTLEVKAGIYYEASLNVPYNDAWISVLSTCLASTSCISHTYDNPPAYFTPNADSTYFILVDHTENSTEHDYTLTVREVTPPCPLNSGWPCTCDIYGSCNDGSLCTHISTLNDTGLGVCTPECDNDIPSDPACSDTIYNGNQSCTLGDTGTGTGYCGIFDCNLEEKSCPYDQSCKVFYNLDLCWP